MFRVTKVFTWKMCTAVEVVFESDYRRKTGRNEIAGGGLGNMLEI